MSGRPKALINWHDVDEYLAAGGSGREIAAELGLNPHTIYERCVTDHGITFTEYSQQKCSKGDLKIKKAQFEKALGLNKDADNTMLIWLGKQRLGQKEPETHVKYTEDQVSNHKSLLQKLDELQISERKIAEITTNADHKS